MDLSLEISLNKAAETIKQAILDAQYEAAKGVNNIQLMLYYSVGRFISLNTRRNKWGTNAIATISQLLKQDMPGLRGFSESNIKKMRIFYEEWSDLDENKSFIQTNEFESVALAVVVVVVVDVVGVVDAVLDIKINYLNYY